MSTGRPLFQIHLSTAIVLMFVASGLLWLNMVPRLKSTQEFRFSPPGCVSMDLPVDNYGWPFTWNVRIESEIATAVEETKLFSKPYGVQHFHLALNTTVGFVTLFASAMLFELLLRRREARKR